MTPLEPCMIETCPGGPARIAFPIAESVEMWGSSPQGPGADVS